MKTIISIILAVTSFYIQAGAQVQNVVIPGTQVRTITSSIVAGQEYQLFISLPAGYQEASKKFPVLYVLDGQWDFALAYSIFGEQYFDGFIPGIIIVGITWGGKNPNPDSLRARDYTPTNEMRSPQSGGAANFLSFMKKELFPFIEANYKADPKDRILMGCSLGGLFALYTLFTEPGIFQRYVAASPAFGWDNEVIYQYGRKYFEKKSMANAKLFMCMGGVERGVPGFEKLTMYLHEQNDGSLQVKTRVLENTGHSGTKAEGFARGLQYVFERPSLNLDTSALNKYTGSYQLPNGNIIEIKIENNQMILYLSAGNRYSLQAATETDFYSTAEFLNVKFKKDSNENITGFLLERYGGETFIKKIK